MSPKFSMQRTRLATLPIAAIISTSVNADITGAFSYDSIIMADQFGGGQVPVFVQDLYFISNNSDDVVLAAFDLLLEPTAQIDYYQAPFAYGWNPGNLGGIFDTESVRQADSFVTIGGFGSDASTPLQIPGAGGDTQFDRNFGDPDTPFPGTAAGWFNGSPPTLAGAVHDTPLGTLGTFVGRFSYVGDPWDSPLYKSRISAEWNQGIGTPGESASFLINWIPSPATLGLFALAGLRSSSRRRT
ncbi:MAG: hypothetical protein P8J59_10550 [Phycisphaerales bacterium]|nr:hypothetical protein [Phycisphaerales bacterium]